jgi:hypothetical protein
LRMFLRINKLNTLSGCSATIKMGIPRQSG